MNNFGLPADASYTPEGAVTFNKPTSTRLQEEVLLHLLELKQQLAGLQQEIKELKQQSQPSDQAE